MHGVRSLDIGATLTVYLDRSPVYIVPRVISALLSTPATGGAMAG